MHVGRAAQFGMRRVPRDEEILNVAGREQPGHGDPDQAAGFIGLEGESSAHPENFIRNRLQFG